MKMGFRAVFSIIACLLPLPLTAAVIHVPADQPTIQAGIDAAADGDTVLVADGTYTGPGNRDIEFLGKSILVTSENGADTCIIDCESTTRGFFFHSGEKADAILAGFTIRNGFAATNGGGIACEAASPTIRGNVITACSASSYGGALYLSGSGALITGCVITGNDASSYGGGIYCNGSGVVIENSEITANKGQPGGGIYCFGTVVIRDNMITDNEARYYGGGLHFGGEVTVTGNLIGWNRTTDNHDWGGGGMYVRYSTPTIRGNTIIGNETRASGGGMYVYIQTAPYIEDNLITGNFANDSGGGIYLEKSGSRITGNTISANSAASGGGGLACFRSSPMVTNNLFFGNSAGFDGGAVSVRYHANPRIRHCTMAGNSAGTRGGGIACYLDTEPLVANSILWGNQAPNGSEIFVGSADDPSMLSISFSDVEGGEAAAFVVAGNSIDWGDGMIDAEPLFTTGPQGDYYLSQIDAGQTDHSPCVDAGEPWGMMFEGTTRTDTMQDSGTVDMGYHYPLSTTPLLVAGPGPDSSNPPLVRVFPPEQDAGHEFEFSAYGSNHFGVNVAVGDVDGDSLDEIITGAGPGEMYGPHVRGFDVIGTPLPGLSFLAYGTSRWGVNVAAGDIDADGFDEIITGAGSGEVFGPHVRGWKYDGASGVTPIPGVSFFAYGTHKWGVNVSAGDIDGDGFDEIVTGAGPGAEYGPHVRGWDVDGGTAAAIPGVSFFAYGTSRMGVKVTCGDLDGDGIDEMVTGPGPSGAFGAHIRGWNYDGSAVAPLSGFNFFAWPPNQAHNGATVCSGADLNGDGRDELVAGMGPDPNAGGEVKVFEYDGSRVTLILSLDAYPDMTLTHGANVAAGGF